MRVRSQSRPSPPWSFGWDNKPMNQLRVSLTLTETTPGQATLLPGPFRQRMERNRKYLTSLTSENLLRPYLFEAGLWNYSGSAGTTVGAKAEGGPATWHW